ncbi:MAG: response regulator [Planctomycetota bacterium]|nr:response regulator [Planctomycetota bacterium]
MSTDATILVVDDEAIVVCMLAMRLRDHGYRVLEARNGREALDAMKRTAPTLIITDFQMPIMSGLELAQTLLADPASRTIPVIMLTARSHKLNVAELKLTNVRQVLPKPFSAKEILSLVDELLTHEEMNDSLVEKDEAA